MKKYILEIIVFICGAVVMIYELAGSRILAPYLGTSIFVWTSLIGVILGSLSLGYYLGGRLADKQAKIETLDLIILATSLLILFVYMIKEGLLGMTVATLGLKFGSIFAALMLFAPASITMGMVSPYAARLKLNNLENSGRTIGNLYAISTLGSIVGTFMAGFVLIPKLGVDRIVLLLILILLILSLVSSRQKRTIKIIFLVLTGLFFIFPITNRNMVSIDTSYNRVWLSSRQQGDRQILRLQTDPTSIQSQMFVDAPNELAAEYTKYYDLAAYFKPDFQRTLIIGGCT
jgi:predicted membrane-bound spermidine synthase